MKKIRPLNLYAIQRIREVKNLRFTNLYITTPLILFTLLLFFRYPHLLFAIFIVALLIGNLLVTKALRVVEQDFSLFKKYDMLFAIYFALVILYIIYLTNGLNSIFLIYAIFGILSVAFFYEDESALAHLGVLYTGFIVIGFLQLNNHLPKFNPTIKLFNVNSLKSFIIWYAFWLYGGIMIYIFGRFTKKNTREQIKNFENYLSLISDFFLLTRRQQAEIIYINGKKPERYDTDFSKFIGKKFTEFIHKTDIPKMLKRKEEGEKTGVFEPAMIKIVLPKGTFVFSIFTAPYFKNYNLTVGIDITEEYRKNRRLEMQKRVIYSAYFADAIVHELNNITTVYELDFPFIEDEKRKRRLSAALQRQKQLIGTFSLYTKDTYEIREKVNICAVIRESIYFAQILPATVPITYHFICENEELHIMASPEYIRLAINNILANSVRAISSKGQPGTIEVHISQNHANDSITIKIKDNGIGISKEAQKHIFDISYKPRKRKNEHGIGLGLFITKSIVNAYGGEINVTSKLGEWTEFNITFPKC